MRVVWKNEHRILRMARPTEYRPEYCNTAIEQGKLGKSKAQIASVIGVSRNTLDNWAKEHPEFLSAIAHARDLALAWWEDQAQRGLWETPEGERLNPQLWSRSMAARFPEDYRENSRMELTGKDGGPLEISDTERAAKIAAILASAQTRKDEDASDLV